MKYLTALARENSLSYSLIQLLGSVLFFLVASVSFALSAPSDFELVRERVVEEYLVSGIDDAAIAGLLDTQNRDGTWPGINYQDVSRTGFEHYFHTGIPKQHFIWQHSLNQGF